MQQMPPPRSSKLRDEAAAKKVVRECEALELSCLSLKVAFVKVVNARFVKAE
jgi:hypothetical protein